ncbi:MAG: iron hydrogenase, partial [Desulfovibrio sp.]|nr:iron hydrogenase [Desulfovibrio sp.]
EDVRKGTSPYHFVEFMACPGGCVCGGGQPLMPTLLEFADRKATHLFASLRKRLTEAQKQA